MKIIIKIGVALAGLIGGAALFDALADRTADKVVEKLVMAEASNTTDLDDGVLEPDEIN